MTALKFQGQSTLSALARGLDSLKQIKETYTNKRLQTMREVMSDHDMAIGTAALCFIGAIGCVIGGFAVSAEYFSFSVFWLAVAIVFMLPTLWDLKTKR